MTLSLEPEKVLEEIRAQARARDEQLEGIASLLEEYPGDKRNLGRRPRYGRGGGVYGEHNPENAAFEYVSHMMSQLVWANPRWRVTTRRPRAQQMVAEAQHWGMNRWTVDSNLKTTLEDLAVDYCFAWAVAHTSATWRPESYEHEDPILWPQVDRVSFADFGFDHRAASFRKAQMMWHRYRMQKDDLIELARKDREQPRHMREGWDLATIRELSTSSRGEEGLRGIKGLTYAEVGGYDAPDREEVELASVYFPGMQLPRKPGPEEGFNGTIATYAISTSARHKGSPVMVRPPRPHFGPRWGPYTLMGAYIVPDCPFPLSVMAATSGHIEQASRIGQAINAQVETYKRLGIVSSLDPTLAQRIQNGRSDSVFNSRSANIEGLFKELEAGGTTAPNIAAYQMYRERRDRAMGMDDVQRGNVEGLGTATEVTAAMEASMGRQAYVVGRFQDGVRRIGKSVSWLMFHTDEIMFPLGPDANEGLGLEPEDEAWFVGGHFAEGSGATWDDLGLEIEPYSMERPTAARLQGHGMAIASVIQMAPMFPQLAQMGADVRGILDALGEAYGMPKLSRLFPGIESVDLSMIQPAEAQPRQARDMGVMGLMRSLRLGTPEVGQGGGFGGQKPQGALSGAGFPAQSA